MRKIISLFLLIASFLGCRKNCPPKDFAKGIIVEEYTFDNCIIPEFPESNYVIETDSAYQKLLVKNVCASYFLPPINFSQYTLLGKFASGGCKVDFYKQVLKNEEIKTYIFNVYVCEKGLCKREAISMNWVLVPKLPQGYSVEFNVITD